MNRMKKPGMLGIYFTLFLGVVSFVLSKESLETKAVLVSIDQGFVVESSEFRETAVKEKELLHEGAPVKYLSSDSIESPATLEEAIDFDIYEKVNVIATGYTAGIESTGKTASHPQYGITFSGVEVKRDLYSTVAADLNVFPIGTILYIPDYGYGVVADKGSAITGNRLDLYYETVSDVYNEWGKREIEVYVIEMGSGHLSEEVLAELNENEALQVFRSQFTGE